MIVCAAVLGQTNKPLYLEAFQGSSSEEDTLKFHYVVHCALDAVEEKVSAPRKTPAEVFDTYLGMLYPTADYKVYAYISNTRVKFMLVLDDTQKDEKMRMVFKRFHAAYVEAVCNPFYTTGMPVSSKRFDASIRTIATSLGTA